jgi:hypothetical protein
MKSRVFLIAALMTIATGINAVANEGPRSLAVVAVKGSDIFKVIYKGETVSRVKLNVYNASSRVVFSETLANVDGFIRPLNFTGLVAGEYTVELVNGSTRTTEKISYTPAKAVASKKVVNISRFATANDKYLVAIENAEAETITVRILDRNNNVLYSEIREINGDFSQVYRVSEKTGVKFEIYDAAGLTKLSRF